MEQFEEATVKLSCIFRHGRKIRYAEEVVENLKSLYGLKNLIRRIISAKIHSLKESLEDLMKIFVETVSKEFEIIFSKPLTT